jgi:uncharacterized membrane protein YciS (DUF1049 family)
VPAERRARARKQVWLFVVAAALVFLVALGANRQEISDILVPRTFDQSTAMAVLFVVLVACCLAAFGGLAYLILGTMRGPWRAPVRPKGADLPW